MKKISVIVEVEDYVEGITNRLWYQIETGLLGYSSSDEKEEARQERIRNHNGLRNILGVHLISEGGDE